MLTAMRRSWPWKGLLLLAILGSAGLGRSHAQGTGAGGSILERLQRLQAIGAEPAETPPPIPSVPLERPVDPERYALIPGDQLHLGIWGESPTAHFLTVSPEGDLIVPNAGPVPVAGRSLADAEAQVRSALQPLQGRSRITLRLLAPGKLRLAVGGMVARPGLHELTGTHRLSDLLEAAGGVRPGGSLRRIRLTRLDAAGREVPPERSIDVLPWILRADTDANPFLAPGMQIVVPPIQASVRVRGPVNGRGAPQSGGAVPARFGDRPEEESDSAVEYLEGDTVGAVLDQLGGLSDRATGSGILRRAGEAPRVLDLGAPEGRAVLLSADDVIEVGYAARWVFVTGSVRSPGRIPYFSGLTAREYVSMAGGPTEVGRNSGWTIESADGKRRELDRTAVVPSGAILRVPERTTWRLTAWLSPLSTATALIISIVALTN